MKKNLFIAALVIPLLSVSAQWTQTGGTVVVQPNTLHYVSGAYEVNSGAKTLNKGNVNVQGDFTIDEVNLATEFRNFWTNKTSYGQLIINENSIASGKIIGEFKNTAHTTFYKQPLAVPFTGITAGELADQANIVTQTWANHPRTGTFDPNRWKNSINTWLNTFYALADMKENDIIENSSNSSYLPTNYYSINLRNDSLQSLLSEYKGTPANSAHQVYTDPYTISAGSEGNVNNYSRNIFGEMLGTYLKDAFVALPDYNAWTTPGRYDKPNDYGENLYYFGNPYTSNISLQNIFANPGVKGIVQFTQNDFDPNTYEGNGNHGGPVAPIIIVKDGGNTLGDVNVLEVRPYHTFAIKTDGVLQIIDFNDSNKTFELDYNAPSYIDRNQSNPLYQLKLELNRNNYFVGRTYLVASPNYQAAAQAGNEAYLEDYDTNVDQIFTLQENEDGTVNQDLINVKTYINGFNVDSFVAKPIMLTHQVANQGEFTLTGVLSNDVLNSDNEFYFEDVQEGFIQNITADFSYSFIANETTTDRFRIYWNGIPEQLGVEDVAVVAQTLVFKDGQSHKVRFAKDLNTADIYVYNVLGQLVHSAKSVDTSSDYELPLRKQAAAFVVKVIGDNGVTTTKKIVTK